MSVLKYTDGGWFASLGILLYTKIIIPTHVIELRRLCWAPYALTTYYITVSWVFWENLPKTSDLD